MGLKSSTANAVKYKSRMNKTSTAKAKRLWDTRSELDPRLMYVLWLAGACVVGTSLFATHVLTMSILRGLGEQFQSGNTSTDHQEQLTVTIYTAPAPFEGSVGVRQAVAINSWLRLDPSPTVVLLGKHSSMHGFASNRAPNVTVDTSIDLTFSGKPLFHGIVSRARNCSSDIVVLIDTDVILLRHVFRAIESMRQGFDEDWLVTALPLVVKDFPFSLQGKEIESFGAYVEDEEVEAYIRYNGIWDTCDGAQLWAWNGNRRPLHEGVMPPFVYKEGHHNHWLLSEAITSKHRVVLDASEAFSVFRTQHVWNSFYGDTSNNAVDEKIRGDSVHHIGNAWLASAYGSYYFRGLNFSNISLKLLSCGGLQSENFCMVNMSHNPCSCSSLNPHWTPKKKTWSLFDYPPTWASWFRPLTIKHSEKNQGINCGCSNSLPYQNQIQCKDSKLFGSQIGEFNFSPSLESLVSRVASNDKVVVLAVAGNSYRDMLMSWVCRLKHLQISNFLVSALDDDLFHFASRLGLPVFRSSMDMNVSRDDCHFGTSCFQRVTKMKSRTVLKILRLGFHVLFSDVDVYWFEDPSKELMSFGPGHLPAQTDQWNETEALNKPRHLNSGFYFAWSDSRTIAAFESIIKHAATSDKSEQPSFYDVLCGEAGRYTVGSDTCLEPVLNVTVHFLDPVKYPNGAFRSLWEQKNVRSACKAQGCKVLHNNWVPGRQKKLNRQVSSGLWDYDAATRMCTTNVEPQIS